ncbi:purine nucleoside phosphorylase YfiH [soil metagenome]
MKLIIPDWTAPPNIAALVTTRSGGESLPPYDDGQGGGGLNLAMHVGDDAGRVMRNRALLRELLPAEPSWLSQIHGTSVVDAAQTFDAASYGTIEADASFATEAGVVCAIMTADCLPVIFCDQAGSIVAAAHAGWRGLANGVLENTVSCLRDKGAVEILAWLGPAIGPLQFEVGEDVRSVFVQRDARAEAAFNAFTGRPGKYLADIYQLARLVLAKAGVRQIFGGGLCTVSDPGQFYSYRRDHSTGRFASLVWLK